MKKVVILGAGYGGIKAALTLHKKLRKSKDVEITLIDQNEHHTLLTELHEIAGNRVEEDAVLVPLRDIFQYTKVKLVKDRITGIDFEKKTLSSEGSVYEYDYLVLGIGSEPAFYGIEGMKEYSFTLWSHDDALKIKKHIRNMFAKASIEKNPDARRRLLTFVVGGGGFTGIEMVGELAQWKNHLCKEYGVDKSEVSLYVIEALGDILSVLSDNLIAKAEKYLKKIGVKVMKNSPITKVAPDRIELKSGEVIETYTLIWTGGVQANCDFADSGLEKSNKGRFAVNEYLETNKPNVYAVGDCACFMTEKGHPLPALVEAALQTGECAAKNIIADIKNQKKEACKPKLHGVMVSIGRWWGVADIMGLKLWGIFAIIMKHIVNLHYLFDIGGFELCMRYLSHEFYREKKLQNFIEIHFTTRKPVFWLLPLRLYLGYMWIESGLKKLNEGWWSNVILKNVDAASAATQAASAVSSASQAVDAAASATQAAAGGVSQGFGLISAHTPGWYAWIVETFIYPNAIFFQRMITLTELVLGALLILGLFTFIAGAIGVVMNLNFMLSTGVYDYWFLVASVAVMAGAGAVLGADHYVMPYLLRQWRYFVRNKRIKPFLFS